MASDTHNNRGTIQQTLDDYLAQLREQSDRMMGYPAARDYNYDIIKPFLDVTINNCGDPFVAGTYRGHSHQFELEVLAFWAELMRAPADNWWGYVTNGGTEGNLYGLYLARELLPNSVVYYSKDSHYSVAKNLHFLNMRSIMIRAQPSGEIDYEDLRETIRINRDVPPVIFANIGTTMTEAKDDLAKIQQIMHDLVVPKYYIHADAALCGSFAPFLNPRPKFDFADGAHSLSISGHKFIGSPIPCGIVLALKENVNRIARSVAYIGNLDTTVTGSRNGLTPLILWYAMKCFGRQGMAERAQRSVELAAYALERLKSIGIKAWRNPNAITVLFPEPPADIVAKWQLASANGESHIILMPFLTKTHVDELVRDLQAPSTHDTTRSDTARETNKHRN
ncbi:MAG: histidine decarboxylase [Cellvibrionaceae bacterium]|nr:histidine decarboxylase [Cellvibrionaceae bacterium]